MSMVVDWSAKVGSAAASSRGPLWVASSLTMWPLAARECLVRAAATGATARLNADEYALIASCSGAKSVAEHEAEVVARFNAPAADRPAIARLLQRACELRLLAPLDELVQRSTSTAAESAARCVVVVRTADRPELLARLLESASTVARQFQDERDWHVLDDSRDAANRARNRDLAKSQALSCTWHDVRTGDDLRVALDAAFPDARREIAWLIGADPGTAASYGRPVNQALLRFAGKRFIAIDDDALLDARRCPAAVDGFAVSSANDELFAYATEDEALAACAPAQVDPLAEHERALGRSLGAVWSAAVREQGAPEVDLAAHDALRFGPDARVLFTQNAAVGDPGSSLFPYHLLSLPAASRVHATSDASRVRAAFIDRHAWRGVRQFRLAPRRLLTFTTMAGVDNRSLLPPTSPSHRNEDLLLGGIAQLVHPRAWFADLPFGLPHRRAVAKQWMGPNADFAQEPLHFILDVLEARAGDIAAEDPGERMAMLSSWLHDVAHAGTATFAERLEAHAIDTASRVIFSIRCQLDDVAVPAAWKNALRPWLASPALAIEGKALRGRLAPAALVRDLCANYAAALAVWPALWAHCRQAMA